MSMFSLRFTEEEQHEIDRIVNDVLAEQAWHEAQGKPYNPSNMQPDYRDLTTIDIRASEPTPKIGAGSEGVGDE